MQYYDKPYDIKIDELLRDLDQLFSIVDYCVCISIVGGEPFIYPYLEILLDYLIDNKNVGSVELTTNATKIPSKDVLNRLVDEKVFVEISDYGEIDLMAAFIKVMDEYDVKIHISTNMKWIDYGDCIARNREKDILKKLYAPCVSGKLCKPLFKGRLFPCARAAHLADLGYANNIEFLDIYHCDKSDILSFWLSEYTMACDYCDFTIKTKRFIEPAVQMNGKHFERSKCTIILRDDYDEILGANEWYKQQMDNYKKRVLELEKWTNELQEAKDWLEEQYKLLTDGNK